MAKFLVRLEEADMRISPEQRRAMLEAERENEVQKPDR